MARGPHGTGRGVGRPGPQAPLPAPLPALAAPPARPGKCGTKGGSEK